ncbi:MAG TPA: response regulator transcription factor [Terriglobales bacterium]|nr:response regulator transcription factor [Terriglobales bacterium]
MNERILLVEDEEGLRMTLSDRLQREGYVVNCAHDGIEAVDMAQRLPFDLIILDLMLPRRNGFDVCREIRHSGKNIPILMLTARSETVDKIVGLKLGADDYVTKPFEMAEVVARVEALLRRLPSKTADSRDVLHAGPIRVDLRGTEVTRDGRVVNLSAREFQLLRYFLENRGTTLSRDQLLQTVWGYGGTTFTRTVDVHVASLRQKLEKDPQQPELILTVKGMGYKFAG